MVSLELAEGVLYSTVTLLTPILLAGVTELLVERSGILNLSVEGAMLMGAFTAFMAAFYLGNLGVALAAAALSGLLLCLLFAFLTVTLSLDQMVTGLALNLFVVGVTSYLYRASFQWYVNPIPPHVGETQQPVAIPLLSEIPVIGKALFSQNPLTYVAFLLVAISWWFIYRTRAGLKVRAVGEDPYVADYLGINVGLIRYVLLAMQGAVVGVAGSLLSVGYYNMFLDNMTLGRGYIAVALVILARWNPLYLLGGATLFSFVDALQLRIQAASSAIFPHQFALMMPYLFTIFFLLIAGRRVRGPASLAKPFKKTR